MRKAIFPIIKITFCSLFLPIFVTVHANPMKQQGGVTSLAISPDGKYLFSGSSGHYLSMWDTNTHQLITSLKFRAPPVTSLIITGANSLIASSNAPAVKIKWNDKELKEEKILSTDLYHRSASMELSSDGKHLITAGEQQLRLWNMQTFTRSDFDNHRQEFYRVAFIDDNQSIIASIRGSRLYQFDLTGNDKGPFNELYLPDFLGNFVVIPGSQQLIFLTSSSGQGAIDLYTTKPKITVERIFSFPHYDGNMVISPSGNLLAISDNEKIQIFDLIAREPLFQYQLETPTITNGIYPLIFSPDEKKLFFGQRNSIQEIDLEAKTYNTLATNVDEELWRHLANKSSEITFAAQAKLTRKGVAVLDFLERKLRFEMETLSENDWKKAMDDLGHTSFSTRDRATRLLIAKGYPFHSRMNEYQQNPSPEVQRRIEKIKQGWEDQSRSDGLRVVRTLEVIRRFLPNQKALTLLKQLEQRSSSAYVSKKTTGILKVSMQMFLIPN